MKKLVLSVLLVLVGVATINAQTEKGKWMVAGSTSLSFASTNATFEFDGEEVSDDLRSSVFSITPSVAYFVIDNLAVGVDLTFTSNKNDDGDDDVTTSSFSAIPGAYYFFEAGDNLKPYVSAGVGVISTSSGDEDFQKSNGLAIRGKGGLAYFISQAIAVDFSVQYLNTTQKNKEESDFKTKNSGVGVGVGFSLFL